MKSIHLDGLSLNAEQIVAVAYGASVALDAQQLIGVAKTAAFLSEQVQQQQPLYGVSTGFGSNADKLLGAHHIRASRNNDESLLEELQRNLIITHAVCVGEPFAPEVVRAMMVIRINTLMRGHSGIRVETLQALTDVLNAGIVPIIPQLGSVGASGDLAPLSHLAIVLLGGGEAFYHDQRMSGQQALDKAGLKAIKLSHKEGLALNNGTAQMLSLIHI
jgi:histidine ammonia-lyase